MKSVVKNRYDHFEVQWSPPGLNYSKSIYHDHSKVAGDHFFNYLNSNFE